MRPQEIRAHLRQRPFEPFRIYMSDGSSYDVRHPEMALVSRTKVVIATKLAWDDLPDQLVYCDPVHVTRIEAFDGAQAKKTRKRDK